MTKGWVDRWVKSLFYRYMYTCSLTAATTLIRLNWSTSWNSNCLLWIIIDSRITHLILDLLCHCQKCLFNIRRIFSRGLKEWNWRWFREFLSKFSYIRMIKKIIGGEWYHKVYIMWSNKRRRVFFLPWQQYNQPPFYQLNHSCYQPAIY